MKRALFCASILSACLFAVAGCRDRHPSPEAIRERAAQATSEAARDTKAVVQGVADGLKSNKGPININDSSRDRLESLPGIDSARAQRIIDHRPYSDSAELISRRILTRAEYDRISGQIVAH